MNKLKIKNSKMYRRIPVYCLIAPFLILFFVFTILPILSSVVLSFFFYDTVSAPKFIGFNNYLQMFAGDDVFPSALKNTVLFAILVGPVSFILSFILAWMINDFGKGARTFLSFLFYAPALSGNAYYIWQVFFSGDSYGYANSLLMFLGLSTEPIQWFQNVKYTFVIVAIVQLWLSFGIAFLSNIAGLQNVDRELYEAAAIDGVKTRWHEMWYITVPTMKEILLFGCVMQIQSAFSISAVPMALAGFPSVNYSVETLVTLINDVGNTRHEFGYAAALSVMLFVLMLATKTLMQKFINMSGK
mgnify:FL=1